MYQTLRCIILGNAYLEKQLDVAESSVITTELTSKYSKHVHILFRLIKD